jgi:hypothetical protein
MNVDLTVAHAERSVKLARLEDRRMPLARMLEQSGSFNPEAVATLLGAFNEVVAELGLQATEDRERAAKLIIQLALGQTNFDAAKLREGAVALIRNGDPLRE